VQDRLEIVSRSHTGQVRLNNEDWVAFDADAPVAVLADGMGGLDGGEIASRVAVESIVENLIGNGFRDEHSLRRAVEAANESVRRAASHAASEMGTTVVVWTTAGDDGQCLVAHVGDSRVYRHRSGRLERLTSDHSIVQQMIDEGMLTEAEAEFSPNRNVITRALGLEDQVEVDVRSWVYRAEDLFLLCSDGLTDMLGETGLREAIDRWLRSSGDLGALAEGLVAEANDAGGFDNVSIILVRVR
jgi:protein phosphatase